MKNIRRGVFETNSSSCHSVSLDMTADVLDTIPPTTCIVIPAIDFQNCECRKYADVLTKASYAAQSALLSDPPEMFERIEMFKRVVQKQTGLMVILPQARDCDVQNDCGQQDIEEIIFKDDEALRMFIFNPKSNVHIVFQGM